MPRKKIYRDLYVYMNGILVGKLMRQASGQLVFSYDNEWINWKYTRPISLSLPLTEVPYKGLIVDNFFDNLLPDSEVIRERIQARFNAPSKRSFDLLSFIGGDCVGALQLLDEPKKISIKKITAVPLNDHMIAALLKKYQTAPLGMDRIHDFRISIAGAQEKTALLWHKNRWCLPQGATPTSHIIKLPIGKIKHANIDLSESVENEWLCLKILSAYQLAVNPADIVYFEDIKTLVVARFDRRWAEHNKWLIRLPQEDLCQALGVSGALKYESDGGPGIIEIMNVLLGSHQALQDRKKFMKSLFIFWVLGAIDGHAKNFSIHLEAHGRYQLTPLYDVISAYPLAAQRQLEWQEMKMAMSLKGKNRHYLWAQLQLRHWYSTAERCQFPARLMQEIIEEVFDTMEHTITQVLTQLPPNFPEPMAESIFSGMRQVKRRCGKPLAKII